MQGTQCVGMTASGIKSDERRWGYLGKGCESSRTILSISTLEGTCFESGWVPILFSNSRHR